MKLHLKVLFTAIFIAQAFFTLNLKAEESHTIDLNQILACKNCK